MIIQSFRTNRKITMEKVPNFLLDAKAKTPMGKQNNTQDQESPNTQDKILLGDFMPHFKEQFLKVDDSLDFNNWFVGAGSMVGYNKTDYLPITVTKDQAFLNTKNRVLPLTSIGAVLAYFDKANKELGV